jgi:hypothetical protein
MLKKHVVPIVLIAAGLFLAILAVLLYAPMRTNANPSKVTIYSTDPDFASTSPSHIATSTLNFMRPGTATTTLSAPIDGIDQVDLFILFKASTTNSTLRWRYEYSHNNVDWYLGQEEMVPTEATSTVNVPATFTEYAWKYASSTAEASAGNADTAFKRVQVKDLGARYMRVKFYLPTGSANGAVYAEMLRKEQHR